MPSSINHRVIGAAAAATLAGVPAATAAYLRFKYGPTVFRDLIALRRGAALSKLVGELKEKKTMIVDLFEEHAGKTPEKAFVLHEDEVYTYGEMETEANKLANCLQRHTAVAQRRDTVAIFMRNEPDFVLSWLAFNKLGLRIAMLNYNIKGEGLLHSIKLCHVKLIVCGKENRLVDAIKNIMPELQDLNIQVIILGKIGAVEALPDGISLMDASTESAEPVLRSVRKQMDIYTDDALYIFTSGTTGLPKPAKVPHGKQISGSFVQAGVGLRTDDVVYTSLPMYHSAAFIVGFANVIRVGGTMALSNFSTRHFWDDVRKYRATAVQYIGEICRYLLAQPKLPYDGQYDHKIRYAIGNGLTADIWSDFQTRFNIGHIAEFYGATEGTFFIANLDGTIGNVGRYHGIMQAMADLVTIVQCDYETATPLRGANGMCVVVPPGERGLMLCRLNDSLVFYGYRGDDAANEKKIVRDVKKKGDTFLNTGDLMTHDKHGYLYFKDRLGDTFRWKGENVATTEVAHALNLYPGVQESNVYGVKVPGHGGRVGMAALVLQAETKQLDQKGLYDHVVNSLPPYACPRFVRILKEMTITATFKHKKTDLARDGFDLNVISDPMYFMDEKARRYVPLNEDILRQLTIGQARL